jgi:hypothetical protein
MINLIKIEVSNRSVMSVIIQKVLQGRATYPIVGELETFLISFYN